MVSTEDVTSALGRNVSNTPLNTRYDLVLLFDVQDGNPNGDPDGDNAPRMDDATGEGLVTNVCINRKLRNRVSLVKGEEKGYAIYVTDGAILSDKKRAAYEDLGLEIEMATADTAEDAATGKKAVKGKVRRSGDNINAVRDYMCANYFDVRTFGAVMNTDVPAGTVRGPVQFTFGRSVHKIETKEHTITRCADEKLVERKAGDNRTMGRRHTVGYGLYRAHGFISPADAGKTGFSEADLDVLKSALNMMFESDRASGRGLMTVRGLYAFRHESPLGNAQAGRLFDRVKVAQVTTDEPGSFGDFVVSIDQERMPQGVTLEDWLM